MNHFKDLDLSLTHCDWDFTVYFGRQVSPFSEFYTELVCQLPEFSTFEAGLGLPCAMRRRMQLLVVVLLAHLGATLTGAWRASQPRLQFTHPGKKQHVHF